MLSEAEESENGKKWYVLRDLKRANATTRAYQILQAHAEELQIEVFTPLVKKVVIKSGKREVRETPFIVDLLFVYADKSKFDAVIESMPLLQYRYSRGCKQNDPMTVNDEEMSRFISISRGTERYNYYRPEEVSPSIYGRKVTIVGGTLDGLTGRLMTTRGSKTKRLIIELPGLLALGVEVEAEYIKVEK